MLPDDPWRSPDPALQPLLDASLERFVLDPEGYHGPTHWQRVYLNASLICEAEGTDPLVARCFAFLHDACREDEGRDSGHGARAAHFAVELRERGGVLPLDELGFERVVQACRHHSGRLVTLDPEVMACWDADRLDLLRVGYIPDPARMHTAFAQRPETIRAACDRAEAWVRGGTWPDR